VLALTERTDHMIVCNGYKDEEYIRLALMGQKLGHTVLIVLEKIGEVDTLLKVADEMDVSRRPASASSCPRRAPAAGPRRPARRASSA
jgi:arginine decarboxylase-like protein